MAYLVKYFWVAGVILIFCALKINGRTAIALTAVRIIYTESAGLSTSSTSASKVRSFFRFF